jgi:hypothetical protein
VKSQTAGIESKSHGVCVRGSHPFAKSAKGWGTRQSLIAVLAGLNIPFLCTETHELGEEIVASYLYQIHLYDWLETNEYGRFLVDKDL